jgi:hypothetical protein
VWKRVFELADVADNKYAMIDSTIVSAHRLSAGAVGFEGRLIWVITGAPGVQRCCGGRLRLVGPHAAGR